LKVNLKEKGQIVMIWPDSFSIKSLS